jgi:hypothetical protein
LLILGTAHLGHLAQIDDPHVSLLVRLAAANIFLVLFNMIPAFPMDGGRVLRALLALRLGRARATQVAAFLGQVLAFALGFLGLFGNPLLVFIAIFVYIAAGGEAPHRSNRSKPSTQDRRRLSRYKRRWLVERFFAWIQWQRRILVRWEFYPENFLGFVQLACLVILFKRF